MKSLFVTLCALGLAAWFALDLAQRMAERAAEQEQTPTVTPAPAIALEKAREVENLNQNRVRELEQQLNSQ